MSKPQKIPTREIKIARRGAFKVPQYVTRLDYPRRRAKRGADRVWRSAMHGWWVRYRDNSKFFNDAGEDPGVSLRRAREFLESIYVGPAIRLARKEHADKKNKTGVPGIRIISKPHHRGHTNEIMVEVSATRNGESPKRVYVGTSETATKARMKAAIEKAKGIRAAIVERYLSERRIGARR